MERGERGRGWRSREREVEDGEGERSRGWRGRER